jgi:oligopeptide/dipeptide ABC transporter ATP-binding protein
MSSSAADTILEVQDLSVEIRTAQGIVRPLQNVSFELDRGQALGVVGESGSGKTMTLRSILRLLPRHARITSGKVLFQGVDLLTLDQADLRRIRGRRIGMIFQEPMTALNPLMRVGNQIAEAAVIHLGSGRREARNRAIELMTMVGIPDPVRRFRAWPHELSGGMRQRVMIAIALSCEPDLLLCDEPTTALDVTIQDQVLKVLVRLCKDLNVSLVYVTHDLPVVAHVCQRLAVMYAGRIVESGPIESVLRHPTHPYTYGLLRSVPDFENVRPTLQPIPGSPPDLVALPTGCPFHPRCPLAREDCATGEFPLRTVAPDQASACRYSDECAAMVRSSPVLLDV